MDAKRGAIVWLLAGAGVLFIYGGYKNKNPLQVLAHYLNPSVVVSGFTGSSTLAPSSGASSDKGGTTGKGYSGGGGGGGGGGGITYLNSQGAPADAVPAAYQGTPNSYVPIRSVMA